MNCEALENVLLDLLYEELEGREKEEAEGHLASCPMCQKKAEGFGLVRRVSRMMPEPVMPQHAFTAILAEAQSAAQRWAEGEKVPQKAPASKEEPVSFWARVTAGFRFLLSPPVAVAAALVLVLGVSLSVSDKVSQPSMSVSPQVETYKEAGIPAGAPAPTAAPSSAPAAPPPPMVADAKADKPIAPKEAPKPEEPKVPVEFKQEANEAYAKGSFGGGQGEWDVQTDSDGAGRGLGSEKGKSTVLAPVTPDPADAFQKKSNTGVTSSTGAGTIGGVTAENDRIDPAAYQSSLNLGNQAYNSGNYREADKQYQTAADAAAEGSNEQGTALAAQAQAQAAMKSCDAALATARQITGLSLGAALLAVADCYAAANNNTKAKELYAEVSTFAGDAGAEAKRSLINLETKMSKPSLEENSKSPAKKKQTKSVPPTSIQK